MSKRIAREPLAPVDQNKQQRPKPSPKEDTLVIKQWPMQFDEVQFAALATDGPLPIRGLVLENVLDRPLAPILKRVATRAPRLKYLDLSGNNITLEVIEALGAFSALKVLDLSRCCLTDDACKALGRLTTVKSLDLGYSTLDRSCSTMGDDSLALPAGVQVLDLVGTEIEDRDLPELPRSLVTLKIGAQEEGYLTTMAVLAAVHALPDLRELVIDFPDNMDDGENYVEGALEEACEARGIDVSFVQ